jgi:hypothetical protein
MSASVFSLPDTIPFNNSLFLCGNPILPKAMPPSGSAHSRPVMTSSAHDRIGERTFSGDEARRGE